MANSSGSETNSDAGWNNDVRVSREGKWAVVAGSIAEDALETGRAMWTEVKCSGWVPKALPQCTRSAGPPSDKWKICRTVASRMSSAGRAFCGSGICCDAAQLATQCCAGGRVGELACAQPQFATKTHAANVKILSVCFIGKGIRCRR